MIYAIVIVLNKQSIRMKTNIVLNSSDRNLFGVTVRQETKTSHLNLSDLQDAYDSVRIEKRWTVRRIDSIVATDSFKERCFYILKKQGFINTSFLGFMEECQSKGITAILKECGAWKTTGARQTRTTWTNPYIWVMIAMEMNPELYAEVITWLTDKLILNRIEAGNFYKGLTAQMQERFGEPDYSAVATEINKTVFGYHKTGMRQFASEKELRELTEFEKKLAYALESNFLRTEKELIDHIKTHGQKDLTEGI